MKTIAFGSLMGLFGALAVFLSITLRWKGWVLFLAWVCFYLYGKKPKRMLSVYLQISLGIGLGILIELSGSLLIRYIGPPGLFVVIFMLIGSLAFLVKIKGLQDLTAWFLGLIVFFGVEPDLHPKEIAQLLLFPLATGFVFGAVVNWLVGKFIHVHH